MEAWIKDMQALWQRTTRAVGWGIWLARDTVTHPVEAPLTASGVGTLSMPGWHAVTTLNGRLVALTASPDVAAMVAAIPDLLEPTLRPSGAEATGPGIPDPAASYETGVMHGYETGEADAYRDATAAMDALLGALAAINDPEVQGAVEAARISWREETSHWPTGPKETDNG